VNLELILVDDGSADGSGAICDAYAREHANVRVFHTTNHGVSHARNVGLDHAQGCYIPFLDADDELCAGALDLLLKLLLDHNADIAVGKKLMITRSGEEKHIAFPQKTELWTGTDGLQNALADHPATYAVWGKLYRAELIRDIRFVEGMRVHEDSFFVFSCMLREPCVIVADEAVVRYHLSENSASRSKVTDKHLDILRLAQKKQEMTVAKYPHLQKLTENMMLKAHLALLNNLSKTFDRQFREQERASIRYVRAHQAAFIPTSDNDQKLFDLVISGRYLLWKYLKKLFKR
jgi:glycosyltransferase involved in cell wall biosynthesis